MANPSWLENIFIEAEENNWCTKPYCTTCASLEFRNTFWRTAAKQVNLENRFSSNYARIIDELSEFDSGKRERILKSLIDGLKTLPDSYCKSSGFRTLIIDIYPPFLKHGILIALGEELSGTSAGKNLKLMKEHHQRMVEEARQWSEYHSKDAAKERSKQKRINKEKNHLFRIEKSKIQNLRNIEKINALSKLNPTERLAKIAKDEIIILEAIPIDLIPTKEKDINGLGLLDAFSLIRKIDRRKKHWGRLRWMLEEMAGEVTKFNAFNIHTQAFGLNGSLRMKQFRKMKL